MKTKLKNSFNRFVQTIRYGKFRNLSIKKTAIIEKDVEIDKTGYITIGEKSIIRRWTVLRTYGGYISIGNNCSINSFCHLSGNGGIEIGDNVLIASHTVIVSSNHIFINTNIPIKNQSETRKLVKIEDDCWLGSGAIILEGVTIHRGSVIGAGSVITRDVPAYSVVVGVPGRIIKKRVELTNKEEGEILN